MTTLGAATTRHCHTERKLAQKSECTGHSHGTGQSLSVLNPPFRGTNIQSFVLMEEGPSLSPLSVKYVMRECMAHSGKLPLPMWIKQPLWKGSRPKKAELAQKTTWAKWFDLHRKAVNYWSPWINPKTAPTSGTNCWPANIISSLTLPKFQLATLI